LVNKKMNLILRIIVNLVIINLSSGQINFPANDNRKSTGSGFRLQEAIQTRAGRHLLLVTLLEDLSKPVSVPRFKGRIAYQLPPSLLDPNILQPLIPNRAPNEPTPSCCVLDDVPASTSSSPIALRRANGNLLLQDLLKECDSKGILDIEKGFHLRLFNNTEKALAVALAEVLLARESFAHLLSVAAAIRDSVNEELFKEALLMVIIRREDVGNILPMSTEFLPDSIDGTQIMNDSASGAASSLIEINWNEPPYQTYDRSEPEYNLWYFREDPEVNSHHFYWHILFSNPAVDRRGEFFYYMHQQMLARYNLERHTFGLSQITSLTPDTWDKPIPLGYFPKLAAEIGTPYQGRPDNLILNNLTGLPLSLLGQWYQEIDNAVEAKKVTTASGSTLNLDATNGRDAGISILGDIVESLNSVNDALYGSLHNLGHVFIARITDPLGRHLANTGVMNSPATSMRDPVFYRWHQFINDIFVKYKSSLPPYTEKDLSFPGVKIIESSVITAGQTNQLHTMIDQGEVLTNGLDFTSDTTLRVRYNKLNHHPFHYRIKISSKLSTRAKLRIFLLPQQSPNPRSPLAIEMDRFIVELKKGSNKIERHSEESTVAGKTQRSLLELQEALSSGNITDAEMSQFEGCGWPSNLLVPRGSSNGSPFTLLVMVSKLLPEDAAQSADLQRVSKSAYVQCGLPDSQVPDSRPMGFPFDRPCNWNFMGRSNMAFTDIRIFHEGI